MILDSLDLETDPDFETAWIDGPIWLRLRTGMPVTQFISSLEDIPGISELGADLPEMVLESTPSAVEHAEEQSESAPISEESEEKKAAENADHSSSDDPTFRIGSLPAANKKLVVVNQNDSLTKAITLMLPT